jgi:hypothetical protein
MKECLLEEFMENVSRWLTSDHVEKVFVNRNGQLVINFADGATTVYRISDCSEERLESVLRSLGNKGLRVDSG